MTSEQDRLDLVLELAIKTGRLVVSPDVAEAIRLDIKVSAELEEVGIVVSECPYLEPGTVLACNFRQFLPAHILFFPDL